MLNTTKYLASIDEVRAAFLAGGLGEVSDIKELSDGWFNRIFLASDQSGKKYVIKFAPPSSAPILTYETRAMQSEIDSYRMLEQQTNIKIPKIVFYDCSCTVVPTVYFIMEFLSGTRLDQAKLSAEDKQKVAAQTAWILSEFHKIKPEGYGYPQVGLHKNWYDALRSMTQDLVSDCRKYGKGCKIGKKLLQYIDKFASVLKTAPCSLVNYDLHSMNMFYNKDEKGNVELSVLDLERCIYGDPIGDFIMQNMMAPLEKKSIIPFYNKVAKVPVRCSNAEQIRFYLMMGYLAVIMYTERFSRFNGCKKYFNFVYIVGTVSYKFCAWQAFFKLKRLSKNR